MKFQIVGKRGAIPFTVSSEMIEQYINNHSRSDDIQYLDYLYDETDRQIVGIRGRADLGHGYGFDRGWEEFSLRVGETYSFSHGYTSIDGPTDWSDGSFKITLQLVAQPSPSEEIGGNSMAQTESENPVEMFGMYVAHVGINAQAEEETMQVVDAFDQLLGIPHKNFAPVSEFAGDFVEVMRPGRGRGDKGHIGLHVDDVDAAATWYEARGASFDWDHCAKNPDGTTHLVYFSEPIAGFAIHLTEQA